MKPRKQQEAEFDDEFDEQDSADELSPTDVVATVSGTDWTTETIVSQLVRKNIQLNPSFQRRDAWKRDRKSRFIESLIVGLPIPQIVLAETKQDRGKFIVLDGKQRLLSILQFWGKGEGEHNGFALSSLPMRKDLNRKTFSELSKDDDLEAEFNALCNQPIRTIVIKNWESTNFLHTVFLRLNTGSVSLSPQELRQALLPGRFTNYVDQAAGSSEALQLLLGIDGPDPRMRDIEVLARYFSFRFFSDKYPGRMKKFLDESFAEFNARWDSFEPQLIAAEKEFESGVRDLLKIFGEDVARKPDSPQFNRAIFDALIFFQSRAEIRKLLKSKDAAMRKAYDLLFEEDSAFRQSIESDTAGARNTATRLAMWSERLSKITKHKITPPTIPISVTPSRKHHKK